MGKTNFKSKKIELTLLVLQIIFILGGSLILLELSYPSLFFEESNVVVDPKLDCLKVFRTAHNDVYIQGCVNDKRIANSHIEFRDRLISNSFYYKGGEVNLEIGGRSFSSNKKDNFILEIPLELDNSNVYLIKINEIRIDFNNFSRLITLLLTFSPTIILLIYLAIKKTRSKK